MYIYIYMCVCVCVCVGACGVVVNSIRPIYLHGLNKGLDSKFRICARVEKKQLKKADGDIGQNVVNITIAVGLLVRIP